jgi:hypothetical protein
LSGEFSLNHRYRGDPHCYSDKSTYSLSTYRFGFPPRGSPSLSFTCDLIRVINYARYFYRVLTTYYFVGRAIMPRRCLYGPATPLARLYGIYTMASCTDRNPCFTCFLHTMLASKSLLITLPFLERAESLFFTCYLATVR